MASWERLQIVCEGNVSVEDLKFHLADSAFSHGMSESVRISLRSEVWAFESLVILLFSCLPKAFQPQSSAALKFSADAATESIWSLRAKSQVGERLP